MENLELITNEIFGNNESSIAKDLKLNFKKYLGPTSLGLSEVALIAYSLSNVLKLAPLQQAAQEVLAASEYTPEQIIEAKEIAALMGMLNSYYKFKNFVDNQTDYNAAGLRMNSMAKPSLAKVEFETLALAHSLLNSCEFCVKAHEQELRKLGLTADKIHDTIRLTSVLKAVSLL
ncbi:MAG: carboxymuconolactone decarboxylase family protein [Bdellovibrionota bacterium]